MYLAQVFTTDGSALKHAALMARLNEGKWEYKPVRFLNGAEDQAEFDWALFRDNKYTWRLKKLTER